MSKRMDWGNANRIDRTHAVSVPRLIVALNQYPGKCICGARVAEQTGIVVKVGTSWAIRCRTCSKSLARNMPKPA